MFITKSGKTLEQVIKKAIHDHTVTTAEYDEIINLAHEDSHIDNHEKTLLREFNNMIADNLIKRTP